MLDSLLFLNKSHPLIEHRFLVQENTKKASRFLFLVFLNSLTSLLGIAFDSNFLKSICAVTVLYLTIRSTQIILANLGKLILKRFILILLIVSFYPLLRMFFFVLLNFDFKYFSEAFILDGCYYQLPLWSLAMTIVCINVDFYQLFYSFFRYSFPVGIILSIYTLKGDSESNIGIGHLIISNCLIPLSFFLFSHVNFINRIIGFISLFLIFFISSKIFSRSYTLVGVYILLFFFFKLMTRGQAKSLIIAAISISVLYYFGAFNFFNQESIIQESSVIEKYQFETLFSAFANFFKTGDISKLFYWEGNSRAIILVDAFGNFSLKDLLIGRGFFGTYESFIERSTIEIGLAQELFRWGIFYISALLITIFVSIKWIKKQFFKLPNGYFYKFLYIIVCLKLLDSFIYGVPVVSVYNFLFFWGIMLPLVRSDLFKEFKICS